MRAHFKMLPLTHFLAGLSLGVFGYSQGLFGEEYVILTAVVSTLIDLDHLVTYFSSGRGGLKAHWNRLVLDRLRHKRTFIHHAQGFFVVCFLIAILHSVNKPLFYCLGFAYVSHMLLDHVHVRHTPHIRSYHLDAAGLILPYTLLELSLDVVFLVYLVWWVV
ncbi:MAG: metal-dependent hydrolase [Candidatus Altiarchaeota archaeon]